MGKISGIKQDIIGLEIRVNDLVVLVNPAENSDDSCHCRVEKIGRPDGWMSPEVSPRSPAEAHRRWAAISRKLRLLRAHDIMHKLSNTHHYRVTHQGRLLLNSILSAQ